ncbi:MAG: type II toxin-antitoxin system VapC family toxin [Frankia sp.]
MTTSPKNSPEDDQAVAIGLLDTSVVIDLETIAAGILPARIAIASVTLAELGAGLHTSDDPIERAARLGRLQVIEASVDPLPFDTVAARAYSHLVALVIAAGQSPRPRRLDLMIAATAAGNDLPLYTRNPGDFAALTRDLTVVAV